MKPRPGSPPWRVLLALAAGVLTAHALLLRASPARFGPEANEKSRPRTFATRSVEAPPPPEAPATPVQAAAVQKPRPKKPAAPAERARPAIDLIAPPLAESELAPLSAAAAPEPANVEPVAEISPAVAATPAQGSGTAAISMAQPALPETTRVDTVRLPGAVRLTYNTLGASGGKNYYASSDLSWKNNGGQYEAVLTVTASFPASLLIKPRTIKSEGQVTESGLAPRRFSDKWRSERAAHFESDKGKVTFSANTPDAPLIDGAQDRMSFFLQLTGILAGNPAAFPPGSSITLYTVGPTQADIWTFLVESEETVMVPKGAISSLKLSRKPRREFDQKVEVWFAPSLDYLPVKTRITEQSGDFVDQQLEDVIRP